MGDRLRVLILEDRASDAELVADALRRSGLEFTWKRVDRESEYLAALEDKPDVVLADFKVPGFGALDALDATRAQGSDVPVIIITGSLGDEIAAECIKRGASDYLIKDRLSRLGAAVEKVLEHKRLREEARRADEELRDSESLKSAILESSLDGLVTIDHQGKIVEFNPAAEAMFGISRERALGQSMAELIIPPRLREAHHRGLAHYLATGEGPVLGKRLELEAIRADGMEFPVELAITPIRSRSTSLFTGCIRDITKRKEAETKIVRLNRVYAVLSGINGLLVRVRDRDELYRDACRIAVEAGEFRLAWLGVVDREAMQIRPVAWHGAGEDYIQLMPLGLDETTPEGRGLAGRALRERKAMIADDMAKDPRVLLNKEALERGFRSLVILPLVVSEEAVGVLALYATEVGFFDDEEMKLLLELAGDISFALDHIGKEEKLDYLAYYDALTGLANATLFRDRVDQHVHDAGRTQRKLAVLLIDVDRFKTINDTLGRHAGDEILKQTGKRLTRYCGDPGHLARIGADRFAMVMPDVETEQEVARRTEENLRGCFGEPYWVNDTELRIAARFGIALFPNDGADADELFRNAEAALKKAKAGGERYLFYTQQMTERIAERLALESKLRRALERQEFVLHYQPKFDAQTQRIEGVEALIRWQSPELGLVPPMQFIPLLEETGLIFEVGAWALRQAAFDYRRWQKLGLAAPRVAVNVSAFQLRRRDFVESVQSVLGEGAGAAAIDLELTESLIMEDIRGSIEKLEALRMLGVEIAIDDFGTGYSSLAYLAKLPVQTLKIDRSFIITMLGDPSVMTLVSTIVSMAHSMRLKVVAEGVDSEDQVSALKKLGCDQLQGYLFSKPVSFDEMTVLLGSRT